jgi:hypothetical protein
MKKLTLSLVMVLCSMSAASYAQIPSAHFTGYASNNSFNEWCALNNADVSFDVSANGRVQLNWVESGFSRANSPCEHELSAQFTPTSKANEWDVNFNSNFNLMFGTAVLVGNQLVVSAEFNSYNTGFQHFETKFNFSTDQKTLNYIRDIESVGGPSLRANATLYRN